MSDKVKLLLPEVTSEIYEERRKRIKALLKEKSQEIEAARKMLKTMEKQYDKLLETDINEFYFPHEIEEPNIKYWPVKG